MLNKKYEEELFIDFLITRNNIEEIVSKYEEEIIKLFSWENVVLIYAQIATSKLYSKEQIDNFKYILDFIIKNMEKNKSSEEDIECLRSISEEIKDIEPTYDFYYKEFSSKFIDIDEFINNSYHFISKSEMDNSVQFDYYAYKYLTNLELENMPDFMNNPNFILSINKFLCQNSSMFEDISIREYTIECLEKLKLYFETNNIQNYSKQINKIEYLIRKNKPVTDISLIKQYGIILLIHKVIVDNRKIEETEYKDLILKDYFIENLYIVLENMLYAEFGKHYGLDIKERLEYVLSYILENRNDNKMKIKYNEMIYLLRKIEFSQVNYFLYADAEIKYNNFELLKRLFIRKIFGRDISLEEDVKISIGVDYDVFKLLFSKDDLDEIQINPYYARSIKKFVNDIPEIFESDIVTKRADEILNSQKTFRKR